MNYTALAIWLMFLAAIGLVIMFSVGMNSYQRKNPSKVPKSREQETEDRRKAAKRAIASLRDLLVLSPPPLSPFPAQMVDDLLTRLYDYERSLDTQGVTRAVIDNIRLDLEDIREDLTRMKRK